MIYLSVWIMICLICSLLVCILEDGIRLADWKVKVACFSALTLPPLAFLYCFINYRKK